jgi:vacuolar-type H+-ATPase subunit E/Vma4
MSDDRLSRMEEKLDRLSEAVVAMARMEERMLTLFKRMDNFDDTLKKVDDRLDEIERQAIARGQKIAFAERIFWMVCTGAVGLAFVYLR